MSLVTLAINPDGEFDSGLVAVTDASTYVPIGMIPARGRKTVLAIEVGAGGAIAHLKITKAANADGVHAKLAEDADFSTATTSMPEVLGSTIYQTAAGGIAIVTIDNPGSELAIYAKKATADTTVRVRGHVVRKH